MFYLFHKICLILTKIGCQRILIKVPNTKFHKTITALLSHAQKKDTQRDVLKPVAGSRFVRASKI